MSPRGLNNTVGGVSSRPNRPKRRTDEVVVVPKPSRKSRPRRAGSHSHRHRRNLSDAELLVRRDGASSRASLDPAILRNVTAARWRTASVIGARENSSPGTRTARTAHGTASLTCATRPPFPQSEVEATLQRINGHKVRRHCARALPRVFPARPARARPPRVHRLFPSMPLLAKKRPTTSSARRAPPTRRPNQSADHAC